MKLQSWPNYPDRLLGRSQPDLRPIAWRRYRLVAGYCVTVRDEDTKQDFEINIPAGFICDGASVPRIVWTGSGLTPDGLLRAAALVHDWIYYHKGRVHAYSLNRGMDIEGQMISVNREDADRIFLRLMLAAGMPGWRAKVAWRAVRIFGPRW